MHLGTIAFVFAGEHYTTLQIEGSFFSVSPRRRSSQLAEELPNHRDTRNGSAESRPCHLKALLDPNATDFSSAPSTPIDLSSCSSACLAAPKTFAGAPPAASTYRPNECTIVLFVV